MCPLGNRTTRLSRLGPPALRIAVTTAPVVTEPNSLPESPAVFTAQRDRAQALEGRLDFVGVLEVAHLLGLAGAADVVHLLLRAARCDDRQAARKQEVAAVAVFDLDGVAGGTEVVDVGGQNELHCFANSVLR